jgi:hypothetical protein
MLRLVLMQCTLSSNSSMTCQGAHRSMECIVAVRGQPLHGAGMAHWCGSTSEQGSDRAHIVEENHRQPPDLCGFGRQSIALCMLCWHNITSCRCRGFAAAVHAVLLLFQLLSAVPFASFTARTCVVQHQCWVSSYSRSLDCFPVTCGRGLVMLTILSSQHSWPSTNAGATPLFCECKWTVLAELVCC